MARKKTIKDVEVEETKKDTKVEEESLEEVEEVEEELEELDEDLDEDLDDLDEDLSELDEDLEEVDDTKDKKKDKTKKKEKDKKKDKDKKQKKDGFFAQTNKELKKVVWPSAGEIAKYSLAVIIFCVVLCLFFVLINLLASFIKGLF